MKLTDKQFNILYLGSNFKEWFSDVEVSPDTKKLSTIKLPRSMNDKEILRELKPSEITLDEFIGQLGFLDKSERCLGYIKDKNGILRAVRVFWYDDGWRVLAYSVEDPSEWGSDDRVFSCDSFDTQTLGSSDTLSLEPLDTSARLEKLESEMARVLKVLNV